MSSFSRVVPECLIQQVLPMSVNALASSASNCRNFRRYCLVEQSVRQHPLAISRFEGLQAFERILEPFQRVPLAALMRRGDLPASCFKKSIRFAITRIEHSRQEFAHRVEIGCVLPFWRRTRACAISSTNRGISISLRALSRVR